MKYFKSLLVSEINRLKSIREGSQLYFIFFRVGQVSGFIGMVLCFFTLPIISSDLSFVSLATFSSRLYFAMAVAGIITVLLCEAGLRLMDNGRILGFYICFILSLRYLFSSAFLLGLFGLYALLNPSAQRKFLYDAPPWLGEFLTLCRINYVKSGEENNP